MGTWYIKVSNPDNPIMGPTWGTDTPAEPHNITGSFIEDDELWKVSMEGNLSPPNTGTCKVTIPTGDILFLDDATEPIAISEVPLGWTPDSTWIFKPSGECTPPFGDHPDAVQSLTFELPGYFSPFTLTNVGSINPTLPDHWQTFTGMSVVAMTALQGLDIDVSGHAEYPANPMVTLHQPASPILIAGTYFNALQTWWYNPTLDQFEYAEESPGAGWDEADPDPGDPVPVISDIQRVSTYQDGEIVDGAFLTPAHGCAGTTIYIIGTGFGNSATVTVGGSAATSVQVTNQALITCVVPSHADGLVDVTVTNADAQADTFVNGFRYATPWWLQTITYVVDGIETSYSRFVQQCAPPSDGRVVIQSYPGTPTYDPSGWFVSTAAYTGDVFDLGSSSSPKPPRLWADISIWASGDANVFGGAPGAGCVSRNRLIYPATGHTVGTDYPPIRIFDGLSDRLLCRLPPTTGDAIPKAVIAMLAANGTVYLTTHDSGTSSSDWRGRVFQLTIESAVLTPLGDQFAAGEMPYALGWHLGRLWCGTNNGIGTIGKVYYFRPDIDTSWTQDYALASSSAGGVTSLCSYGGNLYVGTDNASASRGKVLKRDGAGAYTTSLTGTSGTAHVNNGYLSLCVFGSNLYAGYWNNDTPAIAKIEKFDGSSWSTAYSGSSGTLKPFISLFVDDGTLFAIGGGAGRVGCILTTANGTSWTDRTANLPESDRALQPITGVVVI